jgi:drug/metabolite transporter (DMT)-like permease
MTDRGTRLSGALIVAVAAIAFSGKAIIVKLAFRYGVDALTLLALRMVFSAPMFVALAWWDSRREKREPLAPADLRAIAILGFIGYYLASYFDFLGLQYVTAALERLLLFIHPTFVLILAAILFKRRITLRDLVAVILSYTGIAFVFGHDLATQPGNVALGAFWVLLSALFYAAYLLGSGRIVGRVGSIRFSCLAGIVSCVAVIAHFAVVRDISAILAQPMPVYNLAILMAAASTVLPIVLTSEGIRRIGASHASIVASIGPIATIFLGAVFLDEAITAVQLAGAALVLAGIVAISMKKG